MTPSLSDFTYSLPKEKIAQHPVFPRDHSRLLFYQDHDITHHRFYELDQLLPSDATLIFNNTKVIPARLVFRKDTGAPIEIFLLYPSEGQATEQALQQVGTCQWIAMIGNKKKWKTDLSRSVQIAEQFVNVTAQLVEEQKNEIRFFWDSRHTFGEIIAAVGSLPLPPYIQRKADQEDGESYQTVYAQHHGAVAAPTAGLHFTEEVLDRLSKKGIKKEYLTLHVGAGTFQPIKEDDFTQHLMHNEAVVIDLDTIQNLIRSSGPRIAIGTTSVRTLESLYWYGVKLEDKHQDDLFYIDKHFAYSYPDAPLNWKESLKRVEEHMLQNKLQSLVGNTEIFIYPGYTFHICEGIITNFHMPGSSLILLIAAFLGADWKTVYQSALNNDYRFLSYGDSSLLLK